MSSIDQVIQPKPKDIGNQFFVQRALPIVGRKMVGPFVFWDHMGPVDIDKDRLMSVRAHPHIGLATITYLFTGEIIHRDSLGNEQAILPGEVNWMTAGRGIVHSERSAPDAKHTLEGIQLWVALPPGSVNVEPSFVHQKEQDLPLIEQGDWQLRLIAGSALGEVSPLPVYSSLFYMEAHSEPGGPLSLDVPADSEAAIYVIEGTIEVEDQSYGSKSMIVMKPGESIQINGAANSRIMLLGGEIFEKKPSVWWNFVAYDSQTMNQAKQMWRSNEFPDVVNEEERIPLPEE
tara:strand:- start:18096 stop:18962 length:867 start_codon:yes stop_codon:yes gene_type:complete